MSKSTGTSSAPDQVIKRYGAEILACGRSEDYRERYPDLRRDLSRCRCLPPDPEYLPVPAGESYDFDPAKDSVPDAQLLDIDRWILLRLQKLTSRMKEAYAHFEFHIVFHGLHNFCTVDLSSSTWTSFKDRLYTAPASFSAAPRGPDGPLQDPERHCAPHGLHSLLHRGEVWGYIPGSQRTG